MIDFSRRVVVVTGVVPGQCRGVRTSPSKRRTTAAIGAVVLVLRLLLVAPSGVATATASVPGHWVASLDRESHGLVDPSRRRRLSRPRSPP